MLDQVSPDGNPFRHIYWLGEVEGQGEEKRLRVLANLKDQLKKVMLGQHRLGHAKTNTGYYSYWHKIRGAVNKKATSAFWTTCKTHEQRNVMRPHRHPLQSKTRCAL